MTEKHITSPDGAPAGLLWFRLGEKFGFRGVLGRYHRLILGETIEQLLDVAREMEAGRA